MPVRKRRRALCSSCCGDGSGTSTVDGDPDAACGPVAGVGVARVAAEGRASRDVAVGGASVTIGKVGTTVTTGFVCSRVTAGELVDPTPGVGTEIVGATVCGSVAVGVTSSAYASRARLFDMGRKERHARSKAQHNAGRERSMGLTALLATPVSVPSVPASVGAWQRSLEEYKSRVNLCPDLEQPKRPMRPPAPLRWRSWVKQESARHGLRVREMTVTEQDCITCRFCKSRL
jgi:hypothetical protein